MSRRKRRGTAVVEFALVAPVFFIMIFGMIEFGRMVMVQQIITNAAREGARYAATLSGSITTTEVITEISGNTEVISAVTTSLTSANITASSITVVATENTDNSTYYVTVTVSVPFKNVSWLPTPLWLGSQTLSAVSVMRLETVMQ